MTILEIKTAVANYFEVPIGDLTVNGQDLGLLALNQVRRQAELGHDFEFQRRLVTVNVDGVTGGNLESAVLYSDGVTPVDVKTVVEIGLFDAHGNLRPVEWTTVAESLERQRAEERFGQTTWRESDELLSGEPAGVPRRFAISGSGIFHFPKSTVDTTYALGLEVYGFSPDWTSAAPSVVLSGETNGGSFVNGAYTEGYLDGTRVFYRKVTSLAFYLMWPYGGDWFVTLPESFYNTSATQRLTLSPAADPESPAGTYTITGGLFAGTPVVTYSAGTSASDTWTNYAAQYLQWGAIVQLNHLFKHFVFRQEGNLPPPEKLRDEGLQAFKDWDASRYEQNRRHNR